MMIFKKKVAVAWILCIFQKKIAVAAARVCGLPSRCCHSNFFFEKCTVSTPQQFFALLFFARAGDLTETSLIHAPEPHSASTVWGICLRPTLLGQFVCPIF